MVRFAVIGTNVITERFLTAARLCPDFRLAMVYSRSLERARAFADRWNAPYITDHLGELAQSDAVDAVYIASPTLLHAPQTIQMLRAGKHVLCEKPAARDEAQWIQMCQAAAESGRILLEAMRPAHLPTLRLLREGMQKIAPLRRAAISYCQYSSRYDTFKSGRVENAFDPTLCNGALMDIGVYCVHLMILLFGKPQKIYADGWFLPGSIDGGGSVLCRYEGMQALVSYSKTHQSDAPGMIEGERGVLYFSPASTPQSVWIDYRDGTTERFSCDVCPDDMRYELDTFLALVEKGGDCTSYQADTALTLQVMDEMRRQIGIDFTCHKCIV